MVVTLRLDGASAGAVAVRMSPLAEMCACLHALDATEHHPVSTRWTAGARGLIDAAELAPLFGSFRARYLFPTDDDGDDDLATELRGIDELPRREFTAMTAQALLGRNESARLDRLHDDRAVRETVRARVGHLSPEGAALIEDLLADPDAVRARLVEFLSTVHASAFAQEWRRVTPALHAEGWRLQRALRRDGPSALAALPAATERRGPWRIEFDKLYHAVAHLRDRRCLVVPSVHTDPHVVVKHYPGYPVVIQFPVAAAPVAAAPPLDVVRRRLAALNDPTRIRLCRATLRRPIPTIELATELGMTSPQVSRHLRVLRDAGLVRTTRDGSVVRYRLDVEAVRSLGPDLLTSLWR